LAAAFSEKNRRFINVNPVTSSKKIHAANDMIALTYGSLPEEYDGWKVSQIVSVAVAVAVVALVLLTSTKRPSSLFNHQVDDEFYIL
jgi:hypothetical protein